jgi:pyruvate ferredoxin oxidoreductase beta subunit/2-oxoisovalerate ferredoxin oxidoreductase beta subunit
MNEHAQQKRDLFIPGHYGCPGCGATLAMRQTLSVLGEDTIVVMPAGCWSTLIGIYPYTCLTVPVISVAFGSTAAIAAGIKSGLSIQGNDHTTVLAWAGDGGTFDIGLQALSGAVERNDDILFICYDNEAYMNTGIQRSSATPYGAWTTTTPVKHFKNRPKKDIDAIMAAHRIPYLATASVAYPEDMFKKAKKAKETKGTRFLHIYAPCPSGWKSRPEDTVKLARLAVQTGIFPLFEIEDGERTTISIKVKERKPINDYLRLQGRFRHLKEQDIAAMQAEVDRKNERLLKNC